MSVTVNVSLRDHAGDQSKYYEFWRRLGENKYNPFKRGTGKVIKVQRGDLK